MARSFVSPGVFLREIDESFLGAGVGAIGAALVGLAPRGPAHTPITVSNFSEYVELFGDLDEDFLLGYLARAYLRNSSTANIVRVLGPEGRTVNGAAVTPGYTADSIWAIVGITGSATAAIHATLEVTASADVVVTDLTSDECFIEISDSGGGGLDPQVAVTASFLTSSANYVKKVLNTDPTKVTTFGYYLRDVYDYAFKTHANGNATYSSASYAVTDFTEGFNSGSTTWIKSQEFGGSTEYDLFRIHTLGHGEAENGRFKISVSNIKASVVPSISEFGTFDLEVRSYADNDKTKDVVELFPNITFDKTSPNYICRAIGDKHVRFDVTNEKMVVHGLYDNRSKFIRVEMTSGSFPDSALPWGFQGLDKPALMYISGTSGEEGELAANVNDALLDLPLVKDLKDKVSQAEASKAFYWGVEFDLSGSLLGRLSKYPIMTGSDAAFSLANVSGSSLATLLYNASNPAASKKQPGDTTSATVLQPDHAKFTLPLAFGFDGFDRRIKEPLKNETQLASVSQLGTQALRQAIDIISDPDFIDINMLVLPGVTSDKVIEYGIDAIEVRADAFFPFDVSGSTVTSVVNEVKGRSFDTNYAATYYPQVTVFDDVNSVAKVLPASIAAAGTIAFNDRVSAPWFAPAGLNRAGLSRETIGFDVLNLGDFLTQDERDTLYENRVNPIARFPDVPQGVIWGQKTLQAKASALDRINVRRLMIRAKKLIASAVKFLVFEPNNGATQTRFKQLVNPILADIRQRQGLEDFKVVMDETTNTPELIDRNILAGKIFLVPTRTAEFLSVDFIISKSGASFNE